MSDESPAAADSIIEHPAAEVVSFPTIKRQVFDVLHDDERNEVWIGMKLRQTVKARLTKDGPVEDVEVNIDQISAIISLDAAKQEVIMALGRDCQALNEKRQRQQALKANGVLGRLTDGLGRAFAGKAH
jgi:hypothetical protein